MGSLSATTAQGSRALPMESSNHLFNLLTSLEPGPMPFLATNHRSGRSQLTQDEKKLEFLWIPPDTVGEKVNTMQLNELFAAHLDLNIAIAHFMLDRIFSRPCFCNIQF